MSPVDLCVRQRGRAVLLPVAQRPLEGVSQAGRHVSRPLRPAAPEHATLQLLPVMFADVQEDVGPIGVGGAVRDVLQIRLCELPPGAQLFDLDVPRAHHQGVVLARLLPVGDPFQQVADGVLGLLSIQREDFLRAQVVDFEERIAVGQGLGAVAAEAAAQRSRRVLQGLHEMESAERHVGFGGNFRLRPMLFRNSAPLPTQVFKRSVVAATAFI